MTTNPLLEGLDALDGKAVRERLIEARRAAVAYVAAHDDMGLQQTIEMTDGIVQRAMREAVRSICRVMDSAAGSRAKAEAGRCFNPVPLAQPKPHRPTPADFAAAARAGAARNAARAASPMRRVPAPVRPAEEPQPDAGVAEPVAAAPPAPVPAPRPRGLANLRRPAVEDAPRDVEASTPAAAAPAPQLPVGPPARRVNEASLDQVKLRALRAKYRNPRLVPFIRPDGTPDWNAPAWDPEDDAIPF